MQANVRQRVSAHDWKVSIDLASEPSARDGLSDTHLWSALLEQGENCPACLVSMYHTSEDTRGACVCLGCKVACAQKFNVL